MKSKAPLILFSCLLLTVGYLNPAMAVTDAELEALEKQKNRPMLQRKRKLTQRLRERQKKLGLLN